MISLLPLVILAITIAVANVCVLHGHHFSPESFTSVVWIGRYSLDTVIRFGKNTLMQITTGPVTAAVDRIYHPMRGECGPAGILCWRLINEYPRQIFKRLD